MPKFTNEQKQQFCDLIRAGHDRASAAQEMGLTGTVFRRVLDKETNRDYDPDFAARYQQALAQRDREAYAQRSPALNEPRKLTSQGHLRWRYLDEADLDTFIEQVRAGTIRNLAARNIGTTMNQIETYAEHHPDFNMRLRDALQVGYPHLVDGLRELAIEQAYDGNYAALRDLLIVHAEEYDRLRTSKHEHGGIGGGPVRVLAAALPQLPKDLLERIIGELEAKNGQPELAPSNKVIDQ